ncbi:hypothetical protein [Agrobacterium tumefaciens]|uniref:hypothetical protein n=1 Tax=Agrobacterium tumefaciens TaxID=358 RepID=UPI001FFC3663|nr:hypothetical protein [Agrobacterium tumefaciens]
MPAIVLSRMRDFSDSASAARMWNINWPPADEVSMLSVSEMKPIPRRFKVSIGAVREGVGADFTAVSCD